ncbi:MAG TPA: universal stress protein [Minicystis sp.]|nr:universal stress protein [Minicystis sp.]
MPRENSAAQARPPEPRRDTAEPSRRSRKKTAPYIVLVGLDLSEPGGRAWRFAFELAAAKGHDSEVHAVVVGARALAPSLRDVSARVTSTHGKAPQGDAEPPSRTPLRVLEHRSPDGDARLMAMHFRTGRPDRAIVQLARELGADVIIVATQPMTPLQRLLGGSVADRIARTAPCPVVVVRPKTDPHEDDAVAELLPRR